MVLISSRILISVLLLFVLYPDKSCSAQTPDLAGKKWVVEGVWRGYQALYRDTVMLVHRVIPRSHDYFEFFEDSTFHFNYFDRPIGQGLEQYRKSLWAPGTWTLDPETLELNLHFTDDRTTQTYRVKSKPENVIIWHNQRPKSKE